MRPDESEAQALKTLAHELGHALLNPEDLTKSADVAEVEVESVAYVVRDALGLDTSDCLIAYVARWSGASADLVKQTRERVIGCARAILESLKTESQEPGTSWRDLDDRQRDSPTWLSRAPSSRELLFFLQHRAGPQGRSFSLLLRALHLHPR